MRRLAWQISFSTGKSCTRSPNTKMLAIDSHRLQAPTVHQFESRLYRLKLGKPAYASQSLTFFYNQSFVAIHPIQMTKYSLHPSFQTNQAAASPHPSKPFLRGPFELLVHNDATWTFFFSKSLGCAKEDLNRMKRTWLSVVVLMVLVLYTQTSVTT